MIRDQIFHSAEQWIQYQKCLMFDDSYTANLILKCESPLEAKRLSYKINGVDRTRWKTDGFEVCLDGLKEKFNQNPLLKLILATTKTKLLVEASTDKVSGTGVGLRDNNVLKQNHWTGHGWLSKMLHQIRDGDD